MNESLNVVGVAIKKLITVGTFLASVVTHSPLSNVGNMDNNIGNIKTTITDTKSNMINGTGVIKEEYVKLSEIKLTDEMREEVGYNNLKNLQSAMEKEKIIEHVNQILYEEGIIKTIDDMRIMNIAATVLYSIESGGGTDLNDSTAGAIGPFQMIKVYTVENLYKKLGGVKRRSTNGQWSYVERHLRDIFKNEIEIPNSNTFDVFARSFGTAAAMCAIDILYIRDNVINNSKKYERNEKELLKYHPEYKNNPDMLKTIIAIEQYNGDFTIGGENDKHRSKTISRITLLDKSQKKDIEREQGFNEYYIAKNVPDILAMCYAQKRVSNEQNISDIEYINGIFAGAEQNPTIKSNEQTKIENNAPGI